MGELLAAPATTRESLAPLDTDGDGRISAMELYDFPGEYAGRIEGIAPELEAPLVRFLDVVGREMRLDTLDAETAREIGVDIETLGGDAAAPLLDYDGLCRLTEIYVADGALAKRLCRKVRAAEAAGTRGDLQAKQQQLAAFRVAIGEHVGGTLTRAQGQALEAISRAL